MCICVVLHLTRECMKAAVVPLIGLRHTHTHTHTNKCNMGLVCMCVHMKISRFSECKQLPLLNCPSWRASRQTQCLL